MFRGESLRPFLLNVHSYSMIDVSSTNNDDRLQHMQPDTNIISPELLYSRGLYPYPLNKINKKNSTTKAARRKSPPRDFSIFAGCGTNSRKKKKKKGGGNGRCCKSPFA